jgi:2-methylcitrate dehydratase PrpD
MDLIFSFADHVLNTNFESLSQEVVEKTKLFILDTLGVAMPGSGAPGVSEVARLMAELGGKPESTVICFGGRLNAMDAALVNSLMMHALDLDDLHEGCIVHPNCCQVPVGFAVAEQNAPVTGKDLITAIVLGVDISCRLASGLIPGMGFVRSGTCGIYGAVGTAAKLRKCTKEEIVNALGIALSQTAGNAQVLLDGALVKRMQPGFAARNGIFSVLLAERGMKGPENAIEGQYGFLELYKRGEISRDRITNDIGKVYETVNLSVKPFPGGRYIHGPAELSIALARQHNLTADDVTEMVVYFPKTAYDYVGRPYNPDLGNPQVMAQFCAAYAAAAGLVRRDLFIGEFEEVVIKDPTIAELAHKTKVEIDNTVKDATATTPVTLKITTKDGNVFSDSVEYLKGHPKNFLSKEEFLAKFRKCVDFSGTEIPKQSLSKVIDLIERLEDVTDVGEIPRLMVKRDV